MEKSKVSSTFDNTNGKELEMKNWTIIASAVAVVGLLLVATVPANADVAGH